MFLFTGLALGSEEGYSPQTLPQQEVYSSCVHYCDSFLPRNRRHLSHLLNHIKSFFLEGKAHKNLLSLLLGVCCCTFSVRSQVITKKKRDVALLSCNRMFFVKRLKYYKRCLRLKMVHSEGSAKHYVVYDTFNTRLGHVPVVHLNC